MTQPDHTHARPAELETHAAAVDRIADALATVHNRGTSTSVSGAAYGKLCWSITIPLGFLQNLLTDAIQAASQSADDGAQRLRTAAEGYRASDAAAVDRMANPGGQR